MSIRTILAIACLVSTSLVCGASFADDAPSQKPQYAPLNEAQMSAFLNALAEISMPQRAYQQIIGVYKQIETEAQKSQK